MTVAVETVSEVMISEGEGASDLDVVNLQRYQIAREDSIWWPGIGDVAGSVSIAAAEPEMAVNQMTAPTAAGTADAAYCLRAGGGYFVPTATTRQIALRAGLLMACPDDDEPTGLERKLLSFYHRATDTPITFTTAIGDASNPRIDLIEFKLENVIGNPISLDFEDATTGAKSSATFDKSRQVQMTIQVKQGTAGTSPAYPAPDSGFRPLCAIWVPATHNAVHDPLNLRDLRFPLGGIRCYDVTPPGFILGDVTNHPWNVGDGTANQGGTAAVLPIGGSNKVLVPCPVGGSIARLVGIGIEGEYTTTASVKLVAISNRLSINPTITELADLSSLFPNGVSSFRIMDNGKLISFSSHAKAGARSGRVGDPFWCNGTLCGPAVEAFYNASVAPLTQLGVLIDATGTNSRISMVRFYVADGLG